jgi:hypothetical protein
MGPQLVCPFCFAPEVSSLPLPHEQARESEFRCEKCGNTFHVIDPRHLKGQTGSSVRYIPATRMPPRFSA